MNKNREKQIRVALCQRILPAFRIPIWNRLAQSSDFKLTVFTGAGTGVGSSMATEKDQHFNTHRLLTIPIITGNKYRVFHPGLIYTVLCGDFDLVISEGLTYFPNSLMLAIACRISRIPFIMYEAPPAQGESIARKLLSPIYRKLSVWLITYTHYGKRYFSDKGFPAERITVALNTIDTETVRKRLEEFSIEKDRLKNQLRINDCFVAGYIGALEERKHPEVLLKSVLDLVRQGFQMKALFIGDGSFRDVLEGMIPDESRECVIFVGRRIEDAELYLQLCSVLVLPSQGGLAIPHALTCGIPCIATEDAEGPGVRDYIEDGVNGFVLSGDIQFELSLKLRDLYSNPEKLESIRAGAEASRTNFEISGMINSIVTAVNEVHRINYTDNREK